MWKWDENSQQRTFWGVSLKSSRFRHQSASMKNVNHMKSMKYMIYVHKVHENHKPHEIYESLSYASCLHDCT